MAQTYAQLKASAEDILDTIGTDVVSDAVLETMQTDAFIEGLRLFGEYVPHIVTVPYTIESRTGTATSTLANNLVDATESQFLSTDVGKVVYNTTDKTWAEIKTYTSATTVVLSKDIMASGEDYEIYNTECFNNKQINISDVTDYLWVIKAEYPLGYPRNVKHISKNPAIIELEIDFEPDDSKVATSGDQPDTEVLVYFAKRQKLSQLTDTAAAVNLLAGYAAGSTSIILDALQSSGTIEQDQEFTIANVRGIYTVTADATIGTNAATISFYPGLQSAIADNAVVTFTDSTLSRELEPLLVDYVVGKIYQRLAPAYANKVNIGGTGIPNSYFQIGSTMLAEVRAKLNRLAQKESTDYPRT